MTKQGSKGRGRKAFTLIVGLLCLMGCLVWAGCEPQTRVVRIQAMDLSQTLIGEKDIVEIATATGGTEAGEEEMTDEDLSYEQRLALKELLPREEAKPDVGLLALKVFGNPIHGGVPTAVANVPLPPKPKSSGGGRLSGRARKMVKQAKKGIRKK